MHENPKGYGLEPNLKRLLHQYWDEHGVVPKSESYFGRMLHMEKGVTQGGPVSLTILNGGSTGNMWTPGGTSRVCLVGGIAKIIFSMGMAVK